MCSVVCNVCVEQTRTLAGYYFMPTITLNRSRHGLTWSISADTSDDSPQAASETITALTALDCSLRQTFATEQARPLSKSHDPRPKLNWRGVKAYRWLLSQPEHATNARYFWESKVCGGPTFKWLCDNGYVKIEGSESAPIFRAILAQ